MPGRRKKNNQQNFRSFTKKGCITYTINSENNDFDAEDDAKEGVAEENKFEEQEKYGIYYKDDYNYMQHLKDVKEFHNCGMDEVSRTEHAAVEDMDGEDTDARLTLTDLGIPGQSTSGLVSVRLPKTGFSEPPPDMDPEVLAALEDGFDFNDPHNALDDDFMAVANGGTEDVKEEEDMTGQFKRTVHFEDDADEIDSDVCEVDDEEGWSTEEEDEETSDSRQRQASNSHKSRNRNLEVLEAHTEMVMQQQYSEDQIGALDCEELDGRVTFNSDLFRQAADQMIKLDSVVTMKDIFDSPDRVKPVIPESMKYVEEAGSGDEEGIQKEHKRAWSPKRPQWDCVSILSTYSRTKNLPKEVDWSSVIDSSVGTKKKPRRRRDTDEGGSTVDLESVEGLSLRQIEQQQRIERMADMPATYRPPGETPEERRERKKEIKQHKRERRVEKKATKLAFKKEMQKQTKLVQVREIQEKVVSFQNV